MNNINELKAALESQSNKIRAILEEEISSNKSYQIIEDSQGNELDVSEIVELQFFQENDLVQEFLNENDPEEKDFALEELRDLQHSEIMGLEDVIEKNQQFRNSLKKQ